MAVTILAIAFLLVLLFIVVIGYKSIIKRDVSSQELNTEKCSICGGRFEKTKLVERQIGDYKFMHFCRECVMKLYSDLGMKN